MFRKEEKNRQRGKEKVYKGDEGGLEKKSKRVRDGKRKGKRKGEEKDCKTAKGVV